MMYEIQLMLAVGVSIMAVLSLVVAVRPRANRPLSRRRLANL